MPPKNLRPERAGQLRGFNAAMGEGLSGLKTIIESGCPGLLPGLSHHGLSARGNESSCSIAELSSTTNHKKNSARVSWFSFGCLVSFVVTPKRWRGSRLATALPDATGFHSRYSSEEERAGVRRPTVCKLKSPHPNPLPAWAGRGSQQEHHAPLISPPPKILFDKFPQVL